MQLGLGIHGEHGAAIADLQPVDIVVSHVLKQIPSTAISNIRTLYAFANETMAKYSYATSLQAILRYGILISLVQGLGLGFTYGIDVCSCALQLWVGRILVSHGKANGGEIITVLFAIILRGLFCHSQRIKSSSHQLLLI